MAGHAKFMAEQESKDLLRLAALKEPAAAVPSDEEIAQALLDIGGDCPIEVYHTIKLMIQRIGVKL